MARYVRRKGDLVEFSLPRGPGHHLEVVFAGLLPWPGVAASRMRLYDVGVAIAAA